MKYKLLYIFILVFIIFIQLTSVYSSNDSMYDDESLQILNITPFNEDTNVNIYGFNFTIPKGYWLVNESTFINDQLNINGVTFNTMRYQYENNYGKWISIFVYYDSNHKGTLEDIVESHHDGSTHVDELTGEDKINTTIGNHDGVLMYRLLGCQFIYQDGDKIVFISAENENDIEKIIS